MHLLAVVHLQIRCSTELIHAYTCTRTRAQENTHSRVQILSDAKGYRIGIYSWPLMSDLLLYEHKPQSCASRAVLSESLARSVSLSSLCWKMEVDKNTVEQVLREKFGHDGFRSSEQRDAVMCVLKGRRVSVDRPVLVACLHTLLLII